MNSHTTKLNNRRYIETAHQDRKSRKGFLFLRPFLAFSKIVGIMPCKGDRKKFPLTFDKSASCPWRASEKKFSKIPTYSGLRGVVRNEGNFCKSTSIFLLLVCRY